MADKKVKILLVEDDAFLRDIIFKKLTKEGFDVVEAEDGEKALIKADEGGFDIILLDIILPTINGFEVLEKIKSSSKKEVSKTPVIMLSNLGQEDDIQKALSLGADNYLVKAHFTTEEIVKKIKQELSK